MFMSLGIHSRIPTFPKSDFLLRVLGSRRRGPSVWSLAMNKPEKQPSLIRDVAEFFAKLDLPPERLNEGDHAVRSPISGEVIARVKRTDAAEAKAAIGRAVEAFRAWRLVPAPVRGELIRLLGNELRAEKEGLGRLVTIETGYFGNL